MFPTIPWIVKGESLSEETQNFRLLMHLPFTLLTPVQSDSVISTQSRMSSQEFFPGKPPRFTFKT